ncbi:MAG: RNA polymerase factor sigma-54 [Bacillota bacterium]
MPLSLGVSLQQHQTLILTPQLQQALLVLQLPALALEAYARQQVQENPALELGEEDDEEATLPDAAEAPREAEAGPAPDPDADEAGAYDPAEFAAWLGGPVRTTASGVPVLPPPLADHGPTLQDHLLQQVGLAGWDAADQARVRYLVGNLDPSGYLVGPAPLLARDLGVTQTDLESLVALLQSLDPAGVGARSVRECLLIQLRRSGQEGSLAWRLVQDHLEDLAEGRWSRLARLTGAGAQQLEQARAMIQGLDPRPGLAFFSQQEPLYVVPDAFIERVGDDLAVVLNDSALPRVVISPGFRQALTAADEPTRRYIEDRLQAGLWFLRALEQRRQTLYRVVEAVSRRQRRYLEEGPAGLVPLTLREVAQELLLHESTVSRAVAGKYVQTPRGLKPLRYFFGSGVAGPGGEGISATGVKRLIKALIHGEDPRHPLSDDGLCRRLRDEGIAIARRTVAKYREELGIPSSAKRRRLV